MSLANALAKAAYLRVLFCFDKRFTRNLQGQSFCSFPTEISSFCPLLAALRALNSWTSYDLDPLTSIFYYRKMKVVNFIHDSVVTKNLRDSTLPTYPNPHQFYNLHLKDVRTQSVRVITCLILVVAKLSNATIEHRLLLNPSACKVYVCENLSLVSQVSTS